MSTDKGADRPGLITGARYAGINPEYEDSVSAVNAASDSGLRRYPANNHTSAPNDAASQELSVSDVMLAYEPKSGNCNVLQLPPKIIDAILSYLSPVELAVATQVCRKFHQHADTDVHWQRHVQPTSQVIR
ncbi:hypothetical protein PG994_008232 [Apiospora phragmitis]|uniref:F-box domain-containing protein n=1 Tax=Apiospora phragmitis TaxID=2905665 RepID=A0ABR1UUV4_9PEZI